MSIGQLLIRCGLAHVRADRFVSRALERSRSLVHVLLSESLSAAEQASLTQCIYAQRQTYGPPGLWPWERAWFERDLPPAPARVLVGGCGSGRELKALLEQGYEVDGFEPVSSLLASARRALSGSARLWQLGYEDLAREPASAPAPAASLARERLELEGAAPYSAVILGWGSFSHVLERSVRERALLALDRLCPSGPLLLSFHAARPREPAQRARALEERVRSVGRGVRTLRGFARDGERPDAFLPHAGFIHTVSEEELRALARSVRREVRWGDQQRAYAHASFVPLAAPGEASPPA